MEIRKLHKGEVADASLISLIAFHARVDSLEGKREQIEAEYKDDNWGAFADDGTLMARIINNRFTSRFDGHEILNGGIGAVSTLPEYRVGGAVRKMFDKILPRAREEGEIISTLYPFNHAFYRKFGYELSYSFTRYEFPVTALKGFRFDGWAKMWHPGETPELFTQVYNQFAAPYNLSLVRDDGRMSNHVRGAYYKDRRFCYLLGDADGPCAYVVFDDVSENEDYRIDCSDVAYLGKRGLHALLGFLARFTADYKTIHIRFPGEVNLPSLVDEPYEVTRKANNAYMARIVNAPKALSLMKKPENAEFTIAIRDELLPENDGTWLVTSDGVEKTTRKADLTVSERALAPMILGYTALQEAELRRDVEVAANRETLKKVFIQKPIYISDHF